ncbi:MAG: hypothetical protein ACOC32_02605 [Nanoarchaeota archaeon]
MKRLLNLSSKKAQFYVIAAIILSSMAVVVVSNNLMGVKDRSVFDELRENFLVESYMAINGATARQVSVPDAFDSYVIRYKDYAAGRNIDFDLVYLLLLDDQIIIENHLDENVRILTSFHDFVLNGSSGQNITAENAVTVQKDGRDYLFVFNDNPVQLRALFELRVR